MTPELVQQWARECLFDPKCPLDIHRLQRFAALACAWQAKLEREECVRAAETVLVKKDGTPEETQQTIVNFIRSPKGGDGVNAYTFEIPWRNDVPHVPDL